MTSARCYFLTLWSFDAVAGTPYHRHPHETRRMPKPKPSPESTYPQLRHRELQQPNNCPGPALGRIRPYRAVSCDKTDRPPSPNRRWDVSIPSFCSGLSPAHLHSNSTLKRSGLLYLSRWASYLWSSLQGSSKYKETQRGFECLEYRCG